jgi:hypothetical protein
MNLCRDLSPSRPARLHFNLTTICIWIVRSFYPRFNTYPMIFNLKTKYFLFLGYRKRRNDQFVFLFLRGRGHPLNWGNQQIIWVHRFWSQMINAQLAIATGAAMRRYQVFLAESSANHLSARIASASWYAQIQSENHLSLGHLSQMKITTWASPLTVLNPRISMQEVAQIRIITTFNWQ